LSGLVVNIDPTNMINWLIIWLYVYSLAVLDYINKIKIDEIKQRRKKNYKYQQAKYNEAIMG